MISGDSLIHRDQLWGYHQILLLPQLIILPCHKFITNNLFLLNQLTAKNAKNPRWIFIHFFFFFFFFFDRKKLQATQKNNNILLYTNIMYQDYLKCRAEITDSILHIPYLIIQQTTVNHCLQNRKELWSINITLSKN